jgi:hypothetical protein
VRDFGSSGNGALGSAPVPEDDVKASAARLGRAIAGEDETTPAQSGDDVRTLWIEYDEQGERYKPWRTVVAESSTHHFNDWTLEGPPTQLTVAKLMERTGGDPKLWMAKWQQQLKLDENDRVMHEVRSLVGILHYMGCYDQLNIGALQSAECACRRLQGIVDAYRVPGKVSWDNANIFAGATSAVDLVAPSLKSWGARKAKDLADVEAMRASHRGGGFTAAPTTGAEEDSHNQPAGGKGSGKAAKAAARRGLAPAEQK